jgi:uncharacterized protein (DUF302 family)
MQESAYAYEKRLAGASFESAKAKVTEALAAEGFGVLTEIDVRATLAKKLHVDFRPYVILGACNPGLAHRALEIEPQIGLLLPCNVVVQASDDGAVVSIFNPRVMLRVVENPGIVPVMNEADERLRRVLEALG